MGAPGVVRPLRLFDHWVIDCATKHSAAVRAARELGPNPTSHAEAEVSRLTIVLINKLHALETLVREYGAKEVFDYRDRPLTAEERIAAQL